MNARANTRSGRLRLASAHCAKVDAELVLSEFQDEVDSWAERS